MAVEPGKDAVTVALDGAGGVLDRLEARADSPRVPTVEKQRAPSPRGLLVDLLEGEADLIGARGLEVKRCQRGELPAAPGRQ